MVEIDFSLIGEVGFWKQKGWIQIGSSLVRRDNFFV